MKPLTLENLKRTFERAKRLKQKYVFIVVRMKGFKKDEVIINAIENVDEKLNYYMQAYDEELNHKYSNSISIIDFGFSCTFAEIQERYLN